MPEKYGKGPTTLRTPRSIAVEKGAGSSELLPSPSYCAQCGHPLDTGLSHGHYDDKADAAKPKGSGGNDQMPAPMKVGGKK